jgi:hypothetical protein
MQYRAPFVVVGWTLFVLVVLGTPPVAEACTCAAPTVSTSIYQAQGANCTKARNKVYNQALAEAALICDSVNAGDVCRDSLTVTSPCTWDAGLGAYTMSGQLYFNCLSCPDECGCPFGWNCVNGSCYPAFSASSGALSSTESAACLAPATASFFQGSGASD